MELEEILDEILDKIYNDVFGQYDTSHIGTFAEIKSIPDTQIEKVIDSYSITPLVNAHSLEELEKAIQRVKKEDNNDISMFI